jgi:hypothetical protein
MFSYMTEALKTFLGAEMIKNTPDNALWPYSAGTRPVPTKQERVNIIGPEEWLRSEIAGGTATA